MKQHHQRIALVGVLFLAFASSAERCGPAAGLMPAYVGGAVVTDDSVVGEYVSVDGDKQPKVFIAREDAAEGPSYVLSFPADKARFRMFMFDVGGQRFADLALERYNAKGKPDGMQMFELPARIYCKVHKAPGGGLGIEYLDAGWFDKELARDPKLIPTLTVPRRQDATDVDLEPLIVGDAKAIQALLAKAAPVDQAWGLGLELVKKGQPAPMFTLKTFTSRYGAAGSAVRKDGVALAVRGGALEYDVDYEGPEDPAKVGVKIRTRLKDVKRIDDLAKALSKAAAAKPAKPVPKEKDRVDVTVVTTCLEAGKAKPKCFDRLADDTSGADFAAADALRKALMEDVKLPPPAPAKP